MGCPQKWCVQLPDFALKGKAVPAHFLSSCWHECSHADEPLGSWWPKQHPRHTGATSRRCWCLWQLVEFQKKNSLGHPAAHQGQQSTDWQNEEKEDSLISDLTLIINVNVHWVSRVVGSTLFLWSVGPKTAYYNLSEELALILETNDSTCFTEASHSHLHNSFFILGWRFLFLLW